MGSRKESLKKALGITEYPWSSDEDEDSSDQRTNTQEAQGATSQQRPINEVRTKTAPYRTISCKPFSATLPQIIETTGPNARQTMNATQQMDCGLQPYNVDRFRSYNNTAQQNGSPVSGHVRSRHNQGRETRRLSTDIQRLLSFKKLAHGMLRHRDKPTSVLMPPRSNPRNRIFSPSIPALTRTIESRVSTNTRRLNAMNYNVGSIFTMNHSPVLDVPTSSSNNLHQQQQQQQQPPRVLNIKTEENTGEHSGGSADAMPNVDISFSDNDTEDTATTQPERNDTHMMEENLEDAAVESSADTITIEEGIIEISEDLITNTSDNAETVIVDGNANDEPSPSTSNSPPETAEVQAIGVKRKRAAADQNGEIFTVKEFNQGLLRLLECPVCLDWMEPPISQCRRGHLVCGRCQSRLSACPVCRSLFSSVRNRAMEGVAEMLRYPCRHGCGREVKLRRRGPHEASCSARKYHCPALSCSERLPLAYTELAQHFQIKHFSMLIIGKKHNFSMKVNAEQHDNWLIMAYDEFFNLRVDVDFPTWGIIAYVSYIGPKCKANNFMYEVRVDGQHHARKLVYTRVTHSDLESPSLNLSRQDCFHLNLDQALNFLRFKNRNCEPEKFLNFHVEISRSDLENPEGANSDS